MKPKNLKVYWVLPYVLLSVIVMLAANCKTSLFDWPPVLNQDPVPMFTANTLTSNVEFDASNSFDPDGEIVCYSWNFGDGSNGEGVHVYHNYKDPGEYFVELRVKDDDEAEATIVQSVKSFPNNIPPTAILTASSTTGNLNTIWIFDGSKSYDPDGHIVTYQFKIIRHSDDKTILNQKGPKNTITQLFKKGDLNGEIKMNFTVELTVWDDCGETDNTFIIITVTES